MNERELTTCKKGLLTALDSFVVQRDYRAQALTLLCEFVQSQPPHLHVFFETPLLEHILRCLENDTSTTVVTLATTALTMLLPNVPSSLVPYLPRLFNIYARLLFWDRERSLAPEGLGPQPIANNDESSASWEKCVFSADIDNASIPNLLQYFTILYGLYPLNFVEYIRKPQRYLRHAEDPNADIIEVQPSEIRQKSERFRQYHVLHPNFYNLTVESEKTDLSRWIKSEASEVVAECTALCLAAEFGVGPEFGVAHDMGLPEADESTRARLDQPFLTGQAIIDGSSRESSWRNSTIAGSLEDTRAQPDVLRRPSQSSHATSFKELAQPRAREGPGDSPTLPPSLGLSASHTNLQDMINSNKVIKSGLHQSLANDSVPSLTLSHQDSVVDKASAKVVAPAPVLVPAGPPLIAEHNSEQVSQLYKRILLLSNDLSFERYMKQQHMAHIGELKRRQLREAATEAETQNLILINRNLRSRLEEAKRSELRAKKESDNRRNLAKKWETDLSAKLKLLREEQKKWNREGAALKRELEAKSEEALKLKMMLCEYETTELNSKQNQQAIRDHGEETVRLKAEIDRLIEVERIYQSKEREAEARLAQAAESINQAAILSTKLAARDTEVQKAKQLYEAQIADLNAKLDDALRGGAPRLGESERGRVVEGALAASRAKTADLQRQHNMLVRKYAALQSSLLDMTANAAKWQSSSSLSKTGLTSDSSDAEVSAIVQGGDPPSPVRRSRRSRGFSDPEFFVEGANKYNVTPPLDALAGTSVGTVIRRPSTPMSGGADSMSGADKTPPDRHLGRGKQPFLVSSPWRRLGGSGLN